MSVHDYATLSQGNRAALLYGGQCSL